MDGSEQGCVVEPASARDDAAMPAADLDVSPELVRTLLRAQHPDLAGLPLARLAHGWDNELYRLGGELVVRLPRRAVAATLVENELAWLPVIATHCSLPVPVPVRRGAPCEAYPYAWSIAPYLPPRPVGEDMLDDKAARALGEFVRGLHVTAPPEAPHNALRGVPLADRRERFELALATAAQRSAIDGAQLRRAWDHCLAAPVWQHAPVWLHGDLHPHNVLWDGRTPSGIIDFGDITSGDPATDLAIAFMCFGPGERATFLDASGADEPTLVRARGWALAIGAAIVASDDDGLARLGRRALAAAR